jgi:rhamnosyltransferase
MKNEINTHCVLDSKVAAIIVLYFPNEVLLDGLLNSLNNTLSHLIVIDNTPSNKQMNISLNWFKSKKYDVEYHSLGDNFGVAKAQNIGIKLAIDHKCDHVILFDQDSTASEGMIEKLLSEEQSLLAKGFNVGSVGPVFIDKKTREFAKVIRYGNIFTNRISVTDHDLNPIKADYLVSSGSLIRASVLRDVGVMFEDLFIDWVDIEWALRAGNLGYVHFVIPKAIMMHCIGDDFIDVGMRKVNLHSDVRHYYIVRNACHLLLNKMMGRRFRTNVFLKIPIYFLFFSLTSKSKIYSIKILLRALSDGFSGRLGKFF